MKPIWSLRLWRDAGIGIRKQPAGVIEFGLVASTDYEAGLGATLYLFKYTFDFGAFWWET